jgi:hypothetical protein
MRERMSDLRMAARALARTSAATAIASPLGMGIDSAWIAGLVRLLVMVNVRKPYAALDACRLHRDRFKVEQ